MQKRTEAHSEEIRQQLAVYRELTKPEQDRLQQHLSGCPSCAATLAAYQAQDELLSALPPVSPSPELALAVRARTVDHRRPARRLSWRWAAVALSLALALTVVSGSMGVAADSLPGDALYPLKRWSEDVRLLFTLDPDTRDRYQEQLAERRREEVREVVRLEREVGVEFSGELVATGDGVWEVNGFTVTVPPEAWAGPPPPLGSLLLLEAQVAEGGIQAHRVRLRQSAEETPGAGVSPEAPMVPSPTVTGTATRTASPWPPSIREPSRLRTPTSGTDWLDRQPTVTPGEGGPGPMPTVTPGERGPGPQVTVTPGEGGPGPMPTITPGEGGPGPLPTVTPGEHGPGPQATVTLSEGGPGPHRTTGPSGPGPQRALASETATPTPSPAAPTGG
jgi:hypothetical protein